MSALPVFASTSLPAATLTPDRRESSIGDVSREFNVTLRALRFYEDRGLLNPRREGQARWYDAAVKARLALILKGKQLGFTLTEIRAMLGANGQPSEAGLGLSRDQAATKLRLLRAERDRIDAGIAELESKLAN